MITKEIAIAATYRQEFHHASLLGSDKQPIRCRVNGKCKVWKTRPTEFQLPVKFGMYDCFYITESNAADWQTAEQSQASSKAKQSKTTKRAEPERGWELVVGNIGTINNFGDDETNARYWFADYVLRSEKLIGRAGGEDVTLFHNGEIVLEHSGKLASEREV